MIKKILLDKLNYNNEFEEAELNEMLSFISSDKQVFNLSNITFIIQDYDKIRKVLTRTRASELFGDSLPLYIINNKPFSVQFITPENISKVFNMELPIYAYTVNAVVSRNPSTAIQLDIDNGYTVINYQDPGPAPKSISNNNEGFDSVDLIVTIWSLQPQEM